MTGKIKTLYIFEEFPHLINNESLNMHSLLLLNTFHEITTPTR